MFAVHQALMVPYIKQKSSVLLNQSSSVAENGTTSGERKENSFKRVNDMDIFFPLLRWKRLLRITEQMENKNKKQLFLENAKFLIHFESVIV